MIENNLLPTAIPQEDYEIAQSTALGAERDVYLTAKPSLVLGIISVPKNGEISYEVINAPMSKKLTGTVTKTDESQTLAGVGTKFLTEVTVGDRIMVPGTANETRFVTAIASDTSLTVGVAFDNTAATQTATLIPSLPIVAFVMQKLRAEAAVQVTFGDLSGTFTPVHYSKNQSFNFASTRAVELIGNGATLITRATVPAVTNVLRGAKIGIVQLPRYSDFVKVGSTKSKDITVPSKTSKNIADGLNSTRYNKPARTREGELRITANDVTGDDGLERFLGETCVAMVETVKEESLVTSRQFMTRYVPSGSISNPEADGEASYDAGGTFQFMATLPAPGTP